MNKSSMSHAPSGAEDGKVVEQAKQAVTHAASSVAEQAREQVNTQFDTRKDKAVETIGNVASAIRDTGEKLKGVGPLGDVADRAADGMEKVASFFEGKHVGDVVRDVERFARREPALFLGAAFAIGLVGGRFLKSSAHRSAEQAQGGRYAIEGGGSYDRYDRYEEAYGSAFGDSGDYGDYADGDYVSGTDVEDDYDAMAFGSSESERPDRSTLPLGSRATQGSPAGSSFGPSGTSRMASPLATSASSTKSSGSSASPSSASPSSGSSTSSPSSSSGTSSTPGGTSTKIGLGGGGGNTGSV